MGAVRVIASGVGEGYEWIRRVVENRREVERLDLYEPGVAASSAAPSSASSSASSASSAIGETFGLWPDAVWLGVALGLVAAIWVGWQVRGVVVRWWGGGGDPLERAFRRMAAETRLDAGAVRSARATARARGLSPTSVLLCPSVRGGRL